MYIGGPPLKEEGMCMSYEHPGVNWCGHDKALSDYFNERYGSFYYRPFRFILKRVVSDAWNQALYKSAIRGSLT